MSVDERPSSAEVPAEISFEEGLRRLEEIVRRLEEEDVPLEESLKLWEEGASLVRKLEAILDRAQERVEQAVKDSAGRVYTIPVEREEG